jgi:cbb3-type cytochrome oxidase maturation protein
MAYILLGFSVTAPFFIWALKNGQFQDQQRARFLPLADDADAAPPPVSRMGRVEGYAMIGLALAGITITGAVLLFCMIRLG